MTDEELLARSLVEPELFEQLVARHGVRVHAYLRRRAPDAADDLLSEVWLAAFAGRDTYRDDLGEVPAWVFGIARNILLGHLRRHRPTVELTSAHDALALADEQWDAVDRRLDAAGLAPALRTAVALLSTEEREVLLLVAWEQLTPTEAAAALGIPAGTARSRLHRARTRIAAAWDHPTYETETTR